MMKAADRRFVRHCAVIQFWCGIITLVLATATAIGGGDVPWPLWVISGWGITFGYIQGYSR